MEEHAWRPFVFIEFDPRQPTFMAHRAARHRPKPRSGPRCHDTDHHLIAAPACRRTLLPPLHRCRLDASEGTCDAVDHAKIIASTAAATTNSRLGSSIRRHRLWPAYPLPKPPPRQIPIDRPSNPHRPEAVHPAPAGSFPGGFRTPALITRGQVTTGRHPKPFTTPAIDRPRPERRPQMESGRSRFARRVMPML
jgi:hypothetical protein